MSQSILIVEDDDPVRETIASQFQHSGWEALPAASVAEARQILATKIVDVALIDLYLPDGTAFDLIPNVRGGAGSPAFIVITSDRDTRVTVRAIKEGAFDYVLKPLDFQELALLAERARALSQSQRVTDRERASERGAAKLAGEHPSIVALRERVHRLASAACDTLLILGETGTGKQLVAQAIHQESDRASRPFVQLNVAAVPATLLESELFGYEKGAFTDARQPRRGLLEDADGGTIFLDEIGELDINLQPKLLRVLEERRFRRLGASREITVSVRVVAATNRDLDQAVRDGRFRRDLLYRLDVARIEIPPLREHAEDIVPLARRFLRQLTLSHSRRGIRFSEGAERALASHNWPGNVRELRNTVERSFFNVSGDEITDRDLQLRIAAFPGPTHHEPPAPPVPAALPQGAQALSLDEAERRHILAVLELCGGNKSEAARRLDISRTTLREKLRGFKDRSVSDQLVSIRPHEM